MRVGTGSIRRTRLRFGPRLGGHITLSSSDVFWARTTATHALEIMARAVTSISHLTKDSRFRLGRAIKHHYRN
jgi:hypothetical protein